MKLKPELEAVELEALTGLNTAGNQDVEHLTMVALKRDQPLALGAMLADGADRRGPFIRPQGLMYTNDDPSVNCLETHLFMDPNRLGDDIAGTAYWHYAEAARVHQLFMDLYPFERRPLPFASVSGPSRKNPYERTIARYQEIFNQFEVVEGQVGALFLVNDRLVGVLVVPDPETYRKIHPFLLGDVIFQTWTFWAYHPRPEPARVSVKAEEVNDLACLKQRLLQDDRETNEILPLYAEATLGTLLTGPGGLVDSCPKVPAERRLRACSFISAPSGQDRFIGELIRDRAGSLVYFKSTAMDAKLRKRVALYEAIHEACWQMSLLLKQQNWTPMQWWSRCYDAGCTFLDREKWLKP